MSRTGCTLADSDVWDPDVTLRADDEEVDVQWKCGIEATVGSHGWKRYDDWDVEALHRSAHKRADVSRTDQSDHHGTLSNGSVGPERSSRDA